MAKPKVLLIQESLKNYRDPIYSLVGEKLDLTVGYTESTEISDCSNYQIIKLPYKKIGKVIWHQHLYKIINQYDVVIFVPHFKLIRVILLPFLYHRPKLVTWSLGVHASYNKLYDLSKKPDLGDSFFEMIQDHADACVFYMPEPIDYWKKYKGINENKYFVAHNTVAVAEFEDVIPQNRDIILFVGTLYKQKGLGELIECYAKAKSKVKNLPKLVIIGKGPERDTIQQQIKDLGIADDTVLTGAIYDETILKDYFIRSIICVSPKQAGLSVLKSFGYGVPFVTRTDAISGGEKNNIQDGQTGLFYDSETDLVNIIVETAINPAKYAQMSSAARNYYLKEASPEMMAQGVVSAVEYALIH